MKWPFARHSHTPARTIGDTGSAATAEPAVADVPNRNGTETVATSRRDWATLPPLQVAGGRPINLTAATWAFTDGLASRQVLVRSARLEHVRHMDAPSGSFRGVLAPSSEHSEAAPELQEPSALPGDRTPSTRRGGHRARAAAAALSPVEQLLAIGDPPRGARLPATELDAIAHAALDTDDDPRNDGELTTRRRAGLADSRRHGLGPAYHGPLPEAMRAERALDTPHDRARAGRRAVDDPRCAGHRPW